MKLGYTKDDITITPTTSWTESRDEFDHVAIIELFCRSMLMSDTESLLETNETRLRDRVIDKIGQEVGLKYGDDYTFGAIRDLVTTANYKEISGNHTFVMRFRGAETFTLFKLKYYG